MAAYTNIDDPSAYFQAKTYTGTSGIHDVTLDGNSDMQPDFVWFKNRTVAYNHQLYDSSRGVNKPLYSSLNSAEASITNGLTRFDPDGFRVSSAAAVNENSMVCWNWKANGGTTASNSDGSITSTVQANQDAGFSIVTYTTAGSAATIGHGLGAKPDVILLKKRNGAIGWLVRHVSTGTSYLSLNSTMAAASNPGPTWTTTEPTTSVYSIGTSTDVNINGGEYIAYCFASKQGYSKFGSYKGSGSTDGAFVYTGFKPAFVIIKCSSAVSHWAMFDSKRAGYNDNNIRLYPNLANAEPSETNIDLLSNGFKLLRSDTDVNNGGSTYLYMAFAENPFVTSTGVPTTAR
jgi:hypothetical protein